MGSRGFFTRGFSVVELLVTLGLIIMLMAIIGAYVMNTRQKANIAVVAHEQKLVRTATNLYLNDMGFYPPEVAKGWDPGFMRPLPWNPDIEAGEDVVLSYLVPHTDCSHCPNNWQDIVERNWDGPYLSEWKDRTPWSGRYDYNYWRGDVVRAGCQIGTGVYLGVEPDYVGEGGLLYEVEQEMIAKKFDAEQCLNGESQVLVDIVR